MNQPTGRHGIEDEPHRRGDRPAADPSEGRARRTLDRERHRDADAELAEHSIYNELAIRPGAAAVVDRDWPCPGCGYNLRGAAVNTPCPECGTVNRQAPPPLDRPSYASHFAAQLEAGAAGRGWGLAAVLALIGGAWAVLGTLLSASAEGVLGLVVVGPLTEEVMKIGSVLVVVETRPWRFGREAQVLVAALGSALGFAVIENALYLLVYIPDPGWAIIAWRWTVCVAVHVGCTAIAAIGACRAWRDARHYLHRGNPATALPWVVAAVVLHGLYNGAAVLAAAAFGWF